MAYRRCGAVYYRKGLSLSSPPCQIFKNRQKPAKRFASVKICHAKIMKILRESSANASRRSVGEPGKPREARVAPFARACNHEHKKNWEIWVYPQIAQIMARFCPKKGKLQTKSGFVPKALSQNSCIFQNIDFLQSFIGHGRHGTL